MSLETCLYIETDVKLYIGGYLDWRDWRVQVYPDVQYSL